jgi:hypothetical protein
VKNEKFMQKTQGKSVRVIMQGRNLKEIEDD